MTQTGMTDAAVPGFSCLAGALHGNLHFIFVVAEGQLPNTSLYAARTRLCRSRSCCAVKSLLEL